MLRNKFSQISRSMLALVFISASLTTTAHVRVPSSIESPAEISIFKEDFSAYTYKNGTLNADWDKWNKNLKLSPIDEALQDADDIAVAEDGSSFVVWSERQGDDSPINIVVQHLDSNGNLLWQSGILTNYGIVATFRSALAINSNGEAIVVFMSDDAHIYAQKLDDDGNRLWTNAIRVDADTSDAERDEPAITIDEYDNALIAWQDTRNGNPDIYAQKLDPDGNVLWVADARIDDGSDEAIRPAIIMTGSGQAVVTWSDKRDGAYHIYAQKIDGDGACQWSNDSKVTTEGVSEIYDQYNPQIASAGSGIAVVVWEEVRDFLPYTSYAYWDSRIYAQKLDSSGNQLWSDGDKLVHSEYQLHLYNRLRYFPRQQDIQIYPDGNILIAMRSLKDWYAQRDIILSKLDPDGEKVWDQDVILTGYGDQQIPSLGMNSDGVAVVIWNDLVSGWDLYAMRVDADATPLWLFNVRVNSANGHAMQKSMDISANVAGEAVVVWDDLRYGIDDIFAQRFDQDGNHLWETDLRVNSRLDEKRAIQPKVSMHSDGRTAFVWFSMSILSSLIQNMDSKGNKLLLIDTPFTIDCQIPDLELDSAHSAIVVCEDYRLGDTDAEIYAYKLNTSGENQWADGVRVSSDPIGNGNNQYLPQISLDASDNAIIIWLDHRNTKAEIYAQKLDQDGTKLWIEDTHVFTNTTDLSWDDLYPSLAVFPNGQSIIAWNRDDGVYAQKLDANGVKLWGDGIKVSVDDSLVFTPAVEVDGDGNAVIAFVEDSQGFIFAQKLDQDGNHLWTENKPVSSQGGTSGSPHIAIDPSGRIWITWRIFGDILLQTMDATGDLLWENEQLVIPDEFFTFPTGVAQSRTVDTAEGDIVSVILTADYKNNGGEVKFSLSNNSGADWEGVIPGVFHVFSTQGSDLHWKAELNSDPLWPRGPVVKNLSIEYTSQSPYADEYEPDDTCASARPIAVNGATQAHNFHQNADQDWTWFEAVDGTRYVIQTTNPMTDTDTTLALYDDCAQPALMEDDDEFSQESHLTWTANFSGTVYLKAANHDPLVYGDLTGYDLSVREVTDPPVAVIVAGHDDENELAANITYMADLAYLTFLGSGIPKDNLYYLNINLDHDLDGDGSSDVAGLPTPANIRDAIQDWAIDQGVALGVPFYLYLADHGGVDRFQADGSSGVIDPAYLDLWLSNLEARSGTDSVTVILEACNSGSFIDITLEGPAEISGRNRVVISSTSSSLNAYASLHGGYFSDTFWTSLAQNKDLETAFLSAIEAIQATELNQTPWLEETGDAVADIQGTILSEGRGLAATFAASPPVIDSAQASLSADGTLILDAQVRDNSAVNKVWVEIFPPSFIEPIPSPDGVIPELDILTSTLQLSGINTYTMALPHLQEAGTYRILVYGLDNGDHFSMPFSIDFVLNKVYLPLVRK